MEQNVNLNNRNGFTLIEFCIAVLIMMVGLMGLLQAINMATVQNLANMLRGEAVALADEKIIDAKKAVVSKATFDALIDSNNLITNRQVRGVFCNYSVVTSVRPLSGNSKEITLRVAWRYKGSKLIHNVSSMVSNPEPI